MAKITLYLNEAQIRSEVSGILTSGMVGVEVELVCDESWEDLSKILICRAGDIAKTTFVKDNRAVVAHETMVAGKWLELGVEGRNDDGSVVIPTLWERCCIVLPGADSSADQTVDPTLPIWMQLQKRVESLEVPHAPSDIGALPTPLAAEVGQYLRVAGVNSIGAVTQVEAVDAPKQNDDAVKTVNGIAPDENGNVQIPVSGGNADQEQITTAINTALAQVKASGEFDGKDGADGKDGKDGYTPVKGVDYFDGQPGKDGDQGEQGVPGKDGVNGKDGTSATHSWNGTVLTVTSASGSSSADLKGDKGDKGDTGATGSPGKDGSDATVTADSVTTALGYVPTDVNDVFDYTKNPTFTNIFDTVAIEYGKCIDANGNASDTSGALATTGFIQIKSGDVIRMKDFSFYREGTPKIALYNSNKELTTTLNCSAIVPGNSYYLKDPATDVDGNLIGFRVDKPSNGFMRICTNTGVIGSDPVLTINEEITYEMGYGEKLNPKVVVDFAQVINAPQKNCWSILPFERLNIAYSYIGRKPVNTVAHFTDAAENFGYNVLKCDVRPTSDGELVCCHDAGFTFDGNGYITTYDSTNQTKIYDVTAATVLGYSFKTGEHPCLVGEYLDVCRKYGKVAFVTIRNEYMDVVIPKLLDELRIHNMTYSTIINCMTYESLVQWRQQDKNVMINYTLNAGVAIDKAQIDRAIGLGYCSLCGFGLISSATTPNHTCDFEYARANGIRLLQAIAYKEGSPEACYAMGYDGCQIAYAWNPVAVSVDAYSKTETENLIATAIGGAIGGSY